MSGHSTSSREEIFLMYVLTESRRAIDAFDEVIRLTGIVRKESFGEVRENGNILSALRMALHFSANVSKVFFPMGNARTASAKALRDLCGMDDNHPLRDRTLRNHVEHIDERLENWAGTERRPYLMFEIAQYPEMKAAATPTEDAVFLIYDVATNEVRVPGETHSLHDLKAAVQDAQTKASEGFAKLREQWGNSPSP
jgi:hypothetical protein